MIELTYTQNGDYLIPDIQPPEATRTLGKYGKMRRQYLKEHRPILYNSLVLGGALHSRMLEIDEAANNRLERMMREMAKAEGITEQLKAADPMRWVGMMNNIKARAEEVILAEMVYS